MSKRLGTYLLPAVFALGGALPGRVCAQLDARSLMRAQQRGENTNLYGVPNPAPEDEEGQAQQPVDSTKEKRIKNRSNPTFSAIRSGRCPTSNGTSPRITTACGSNRSTPRSRRGESTTPSTATAWVMRRSARSARDRFRSTISSGPSGRISVSPPRSTPIFMTCGTRRSTTANVPSCK